MTGSDFINKVPLPFFVINRQEDVIHANDLFFALFAVARNTKETNIRSFLTPEGKAAFHLWLQKGISTGNFPSSVFDFWINEKVTPLKINATIDKNTHRHQINCVLAPIENIEYQASSDEYHEATERFSKAFQYASIGMALVAPDGTWLKVNQSVCNLVGYSENELMKLTFQDITHPDDLDLDLGYLQKMLRGEILTYKIEKRYFHKKGNIVWILLSVSLVRNRNNEPLYFISQIEDITEWKLTQEALRKNEERFQLLVSGTNLGIWEWNNKKKANYFSDKFCELTGYSHKNPDNATVSIFNLVPPEYKESITSKQKSKALKNKSFNIEILLEKKNGEYGWFLSAGKAQLDKNGKPLRIIGYLSDITDKKRADIEFEGLFNSSPEGILIIDQFYKIKIANDFSCRLFECEKEKIEERPISDFIPEFSSHYMANPNFTGNENSKKPENNIELSITGKAGTITPVEIVLNPLENSLSGSMIITIRDISTRIKNIEEQKKILTALDETTDGIFMFDPETLRHIYVNAGASKQLGYSEKELLTMTPIYFKPEFTEQSYRQFIQPLVSGKRKSLLIETIHRHKNGRDMDVEIIFKLARLSETQKVIVAIVRDITERKQAEKALQLSEEKYRQLYENSTFGVYRTTKNGKIILANQALVRLLGFESLEELQKRDLGKEGFSKRSKRNTFIRLIEEQGNVKDYESVWLKKDGTKIFVRENARLTIDEKTGEHFYDATIEDITEKRQIEKERIARQAAEEANKAKSIFLANMSHEIRTPLNSIIGFSNLLYTSLNSSKQKSQAASIRSSGKILLKIINDILDLSKIEAGKMQLTPEPTNLLELIRDIEQVVSPLAKEKNIAFRVKTAITENLNLLIDEVRIKQMLFNVVGNAIKFTEQGQTTLFINTIHKKNGIVDIKIRVEDTGIGIPENQLKSIFKPFTQQEGQSEKIFGGTGLGLTIVKQIVEMMNGTITVNSKVGKGSEFEITLPEIMIDDNVIRKDNSTDFNPSSIRFEEAKILIVDDNQYNRELIKDFLSYSPLHLTEAETGKEAVDLARLHKPDLILMDLKMPVMTGVQAAKRIKKDKTTSHIPIIAVSASVGSNIKDQSELTIFDEFLIKPLAFSLFADTLKKYLKFTLNPQKQKPAGNKEKNIKTNTRQAVNTNQIIEALEREFVPLQKAALKNQVVNQIEDFGKKLATFAEETSCDILLDFAHELCNYVEEFEIKKLLDKLASFPLLVKNLKQQR